MPKYKLAYKVQANDGYIESRTMLLHKPAELRKAMATISGNRVNEHLPDTKVRTLIVQFNISVLDESLQESLDYLL